MAIKGGMMKYICQICGYVYDEEAEGVPFSSLPDDWTCPMCRAPKSMFKAEDEKKPENTEQREIIEDDLERLSPGVLAALFSNLARGSEKQYKEKDAELFRKIAEYFTASSPDAEDADIELLKKLNDDTASSLYPAAKKVAGDDKDRGALRACTWGEKVERIIQAVIAEYENKGESMLDDAEIWVCSICGFVYIGKTPPSICPVCKVPDWKFEMIS